MKPQDIIWLVVFVILILLRKEKLAVIVGLTCLLLAMPLYIRQVFFTAQRLVLYGASFIFLSSMLLLIKRK